MPRKDVMHLYRRAGFGMPLKRLDERSTVSETYAYLLSDSRQYSPLQAAGQTEQVAPGEFLKMDAGEKRDLLKSRQEQIKSLNYSWLMKMCSGEGVLREKMTLFWANHFACRTNNPLFAQQLNNVIRQHALGDYRTLLLEVSKSPAMLQFLNNQQNRKAHPNENFARELLELFTLGHGHYTEKDISEAARAFTGWTFNRDGIFEFRERIHDHGMKEFMGKKGNFRGEDIISILLDQEQTARHITSKFWKAYVNEVLDADRVNALAGKLFTSGWKIEVLLSEVLLSDWFYGDEHIGTLIKSPIELMVPLIRDFKVRFANYNVPIGFQKLLGQVLFNPPNVAGWPGGRNWIDSSSLSFRMRMGRILLTDELPDRMPKDEGDKNNAFDDPLMKPGLKNDASLSEVNAYFAGKEDKKNISLEIQNWLLAVTQVNASLRLPSAPATLSDKDLFIKECILFYTTLPEFQLS